MVGLSYADLTIAQGIGLQQDHALIRATSTEEILAILENTDASLLNGDDFTTIPDPVEVVEDPESETPEGSGTETSEESGTEILEESRVSTPPPLPPNVPAMEGDSIVSHPDLSLSIEPNAPLEPSTVLDSPLETGLPETPNEVPGTIEIAAESVVVSGVDDSVDDTGVFEIVGLNLNGSDGVDRLRGDVGGDRLNGLAGNDVLLGMAGEDRLIGGQGGDRLRGGSGNDILNGGGGIDKLIGQAGDDTLIGGKGSDILRGGAGADVFVVGQQYGFDIIRDFTDGEDILELKGNLRLGQIDKTQIQNGTLLSVGEQDLAFLRGVEAEKLTAQDFS